MASLEHFENDSFRSEKKKSKKDKKEKEARREKERAQADAIDKEILSKKASLERPKSKAPKPPKTYFTDNLKSSQIELPTNSVSTSERKKNFENGQNFYKTDKFKEEPVLKGEKFTGSSKKKVEIVQDLPNNGTIDKKPQQKDRSVDVYHETVRQRATRSTEDIQDVFPEEDQKVVKKATKSLKKARAPQHPQKDINDDELPSVRELRSKFESGKQKMARNDSKESEKRNSSSNNAVKKSGKIDFKKGFNVMSSLTRRSAMSVSKSMQNLSFDKEPNSNSPAKKTEAEMEFSHFTFAETSEDKKKSSNHSGENISNGDENHVSNGGEIRISNGDEAGHDIFKNHVNKLHFEMEDQDPLYVNLQEASSRG